jgi:hypothetical protein
LLLLPAARAAVLVARLKVMVAAAALAGIEAPIMEKLLAAAALPNHFRQ